MIEAKDLFFFIGGIALLGLTAFPLICGRRLVSVPLIYTAVGAGIALAAGGLSFFDPTVNAAILPWVEHLTELIVIIALAGSGLAIDRRMSADCWQHSWFLLGIAMPLTIGAVVLLGSWAGLPLAAAMLLGAALAPTDPVLAREVAVSGPNTDEDDVRVSLTTEAGLNDGLAFPFVWLAIAFALAAAGEQAMDWSRWLLFDVGWRIAAALVAGAATGWLSARFVMSEWGDYRLEGENAGLVLLGTTFLAYGATEMIDGYGFLAVFVAARMGRAYTRGTRRDDYVAMPHRYAEQFEKILLAALLLWLGMFAASGLLADTGWREIAIAFALIFLVRPLAGWLSLLPTRGSRFERFAIAVFGIRGMGSFFYIAYALAHAPFAGADAVWRITVLCVMLSIAFHGALAPIIMARLPKTDAGKTETPPLGAST